VQLVTPSQRAQIIRHVAELLQDSRIAEIAGRWITSATKRDRSRMAQYFPKTLRTPYRSGRAWTFYRFTNDDAAVSNIEWQRDEICNSFTPTQSYKSFRSRGGSSNLPRAQQFETAACNSLFYLGFQKLIRDDQRRDSMSRVAATRRNGLVGRRRR
jgi:hypothetical protein